MSLDRLWPIPDYQSNRHPTPGVRSQEFDINSRVVFYNKKGYAIRGTVRWTGMLEIGDMKVKGIGIETVWLARVQM